MEWKVTYRTGEGVSKEASVTADDRASLFRKLASMGIHPTRIVQSKKPNVRVPRPSAVLRTCAAAAAVLLLLTFGIFLFLKPEEKAPSVTRPKAKPTEAAKPPPQVQREADVRSARVATPPLRTDTGSDASVRPLDAIDDGVPPSKRIVEILSVATNHDGSVLERFRTADGKVRSRQSAPPEAFDNASDQALALAAAGAASGDAMPPLPPMGDADAEFRKSLEREVVIRADDPEEVQALKRSVIAYREEMRKLVAEGHSVADVLREHRELVNRDAAVRSEAERIVRESLDAGDSAEAERRLAQVNEELAAAGIREIEMPLSREQRRAAIRARAREQRGL